MELSNQIKKYRKQLNLSQDELADKIYVSRQTISSWENNKSYPDVHSLIMLSDIFDISIDVLIKGDVEKMKKEIENDVLIMNKYSKIYTMLLGLTILSVVPLISWLGPIGFVPWGIIWMIALYYALKIERIKKNHNISTYKEIMAFCNGKTLDEIAKQSEIEKRPYQNIMKVVLSALVTLIVCFIIGFVINVFG